jgi:FkbM family methyltransferase
MSLKQKIRKYLTKKLGVPEIPLAIERLTNLGFNPTQIFDVGAYRGDFADLCIKHFPTSKIACFEVLEHRIEQLNLLAFKNNSVRVFPTLLGSEIRDSVQFNQAETASSVLVEQVPQNFPVKSYPMTTIDEIVLNNFDGKSPEFLKLDVQGYELEVLKGAEKSLQGIQVILAEISLLDIHQNVPLLSEMIGWLDERNWVAYDICGLTRRPLDQALWQADFIFVQRDSKLRSDKRWGA